MELREATPEDLPAINDIYNHYVATSTCTWQTEPDTLDDRRAWLEAHDAAHPVIVAVRDHEVLGFGSLSWFRERWGYRFTVENSVYVRADLQRQGVGRALLVDLIERAANVGHRSIVAGISADQEASIRFHEAHGFERVAHLRQVGFKHDRWLDLVFLQRLIVPADPV